MVTHVTFMFMYFNFIFIKNAFEECTNFYCVKETQVADWMMKSKKYFQGYLDGTPCNNKNKVNKFNISVNFFTEFWAFFQQSYWCINNKCVPRTNKEPVDGGWGSWGSWTTCSGTCGRSIRKRYRSCVNPRFVENICKNFNYFKLNNF